MDESMKVAVLGAGSWGTTLAIVLDENSHRVTLWEFDKDQAARLRADGENKTFLPGVVIPEGLRVETDMGVALSGADLVLIAVPSHVVRGVARQAADRGNAWETAIVVNAAKGLEEGSLKRMSEVLGEELRVSPGQICTLSGPSHAEEVSRKMPTSIVAAGTDPGTTQRVQAAFFRPYFRVYTNTDITGVELGAALKNIIAIAAGVCDGLGYGDNTKAALLTRGLVEISRLGRKLGAKPETFFGLTGIGDLIVTALSRHSRNRYVGERIGEGQTLDEVLADMVMVAEGVRTTHAAVDMGQRAGVDLPIIKSIDHVLFGGVEPREAINALMNRPPQEEMGWIQFIDRERRTEDEI
jgi:glycerol-3-phosphate dehydrogenase (NAD(P)+)